MTIRSSQKVFTEEEVAGLTGNQPGASQRDMARSKQIGALDARRAAWQVAGDPAEKWLFTNSDLMVLNVLHLSLRHIDPRHRAFQGPSRLRFRKSPVPAVLPSWHPQSDPQLRHREHSADYSCDSCDETARHLHSAGILGTR